MARTYQIPTNFQESGYAFNGMIAIRNLVDAVALGCIGLFVASFFPFEGYSKLSGYILIGGLFSLGGITGINGVPLSTYLMDLYHWNKRRKPYLYNSHGGVYTISAADLMLSEPQLRDALADAIDSIKESMSRGQTDYIEGETFEFAVDPELVALKDAEERQSEEMEQPINETAVAVHTEASATKAPAPVPNINVQSIMLNINPTTQERGDTNEH